MSTESQQPNMPIPGVRYVKRTVMDVEATTLDGETTYREVERTVHVPAPPRDWDMVLVRGLIVGALAATGLSAYWTTDSIGGLLARTSSASAAYAVAGVFDLAWLHSQAREWLDRRDPERAKFPRRAGYVFLAITMGAIIAHGAVEKEWAAGIVGAVVSLLAKGMWVNVLGYYSVPLDPGMAHHLLTRRRRIAVKLALGRERRELRAMEAYERLLYGGQEPGDVQTTRYATGDAALADTVSPAVPTVPPAPSPVSLPASPAAPSVPAPAPPAPAASPVSPQVAPVPAPPVPPVSAPVGGPSPVAGTPAPAPAPVPAPAVPPRLHAVGGPAVTKTDFIRAQLAANPAITLDALTDAVRGEYGDKKDLRKDVRRLRSRIEGKAS